MNIQTTNFTVDSFSKVTWIDVQICNGSDEYCWRDKVDPILSTDGKADKVKPVYPLPLLNLVEAGGVITTVSLNSSLPNTAYMLNSMRLRQNGRHFQTFSYVFSWMKMYKFRLRFHWSLFPRVELTIFQHWVRLWLGAGQATSHYLNQWWLVYWRIYASLGLSELNKLDYQATSYYLSQWWLNVNWIPGNIFHWNMNQNSIIVIQENTTENVVC